MSQANTTLRLDSQLTQGKLGQIGESLVAAVRYLETGRHRGDTTRLINAGQSERVTSEQVWE